MQLGSLTHVMSGLLAGITPHKLRRSHASYLLAVKIHLEVVRERLGHSSIAITMDI
jgi:integrase